MNERLRLEAEFRDRGVASGLRKISGELKEVRRTPGMEAATKWMESFREHAHGFVTEGGGVGGVLNAIGIGGLTAAASLVELVRHFKEVAERTLAMKELGREVGLTTGQIIALNRAAGEFNVGPEKMQAAVNRLKSQMPDFLANQGPLWQEIHGRFPKLSEALKADKNDTEKQIEDIFKFAGQGALQKNPQLQKQFFDLFFGNGDDMERLMSKGPGAFLKELEEQNRHAPDTRALVEQAEAVEKATREFNDAVENLELKAGPAILKGMNDVLGEFNTLFANLDRFEKWREGHTVKQMADDVGQLLQDQLTLTPQQKYDRMHNTGLFAKPADEADTSRRLADMVAERDRLQTALDADRKRPAFSLAGHSDQIMRLQDLNSAIKALKDAALAPEGKREKMSYSGRGFGGGLQRASFGGFGEDNPIIDGVKAGVVAGFHELFAERAAGAGAGGAGGGAFQNAMWGGSTPGRSGGGSGGRGGGGSSGGLSPLGKGVGHHFSAADRQANIRSYAAAIGIDPDYAMRVARSEGFNSFVGDKGTSFGDFQMHIKNNIPGLSLGGLGDIYRKKTGKDPRNPKNELDLDRFALDQAKKGGWGPWHGAAAVGIHGFAGINRGYVPRTIPPLPEDGQATARRRMKLQDVSPKLGAPATVDGSIRADIHLHDRGGAVKKIGVQSQGMVTASMNRWPQMVAPSAEA